LSRTYAWQRRQFSPQGAINLVGIDTFFDFALVMAIIFQSSSNPWQRLLESIVTPGI
jgi:hypothetical protein